VVDHEIAADQLSVSWGFEPGYDDYDYC